MATNPNDPDNIQLHCETYWEPTPEKNITDIAKLLPRGFYTSDAIMWRIDSNSYYAWFDKLPSVDEDGVFTWDTPVCTLCIRVTSEVDETEMPDPNDKDADPAEYHTISVYSSATFPIGVVDQLTQEQLKDIYGNGTCVAYTSEE